MAERLTIKNSDNTYSQPTDTTFEMVFNKLGELEDILEKYGIDIQNLDYILEDYSKNQGIDFAICEERDTLRQERDTWKKACELACIKLMPYRINMVGGLFTNDELKEKINYFYQQAKKEL